MDPQLIQRTRYVLRSRVRRTQTCPVVLFPSACQHLVEWLDHHPIFGSITGSLTRQSGDAVQHLKKVITEVTNATDLTSYNPGFYSAKSVDEHAAVCWLAVSGVAGAVGLREIHRDFVIRNICEYLIGEDLLEIEKVVESVRDVAVDGLYEYLDERLDSRNVIYGILLKYKQRCEWFHRSRLRAVADEGIEGKKGERGLAVDFQEYVFDQQVEFVVEPASSSGEVDLLLREPEGRYLILDAKYVPENASRSLIVEKIAAGVHQVYRYCEDFNEPEGFLVCFNRTPKRITLDLEEADGLNYLRIGGRTVYYLAVSISDEPTASKSGRAEDVHIANAELVSAGV